MKISYSQFLFYLSELGWYSDAILIKESKKFKFYS